VGGSGCGRVVLPQGGLPWGVLWEDEVNNGIAEELLLETLEEDLIGMLFPDEEKLRFLSVFGW
jgi:hypothetical protein